MDYKLALSLKEAGFPIIEHANRAPEPRTFATSYPSHEVFYIPTLEELIGACPTAIEKHELFLRFSSGEWFAGYDSPDYKPARHLSDGRGSTPTEAVARLWLVLNPLKA